MGLVLFSCFSLVSKFSRSEVGRFCVDRNLGLYLVPSTFPPIVVTFRVFAFHFGRANCLRPLSVPETGLTVRITLPVSPLPSELHAKPCDFQTKLLFYTLRRHLQVTDEEDFFQ
jgi:hypothetical protein